MKEKPLFSVIMPNFNKANYIRESIESVLQQTYDNWELVIVDDCSTDNSLDIIGEFTGDRRVKLIRNGVNKGVAFTARNAVDNSSGEIVGTLDSDDVLVNSALEEIVNQYRENPDIGLIYSNHFICDSDLTIHGQADLIDPLPENLSLQELLLGGKSSAVSWQFRTFRKSAYEKVEGYDPTMLCYEDRDLYYQLEKVTRVKCFNKCLIYYRDTFEEGAYRRNPKVQYYWFKCEYRETARRFGLNLPFLRNERVSPFLSNIMFYYLVKKTSVSRELLRSKIKHFLVEMGNARVNDNKLIAWLYYANAFLYDPSTLSFSKLKKYSKTGNGVQ